MNAFSVFVYLFACAYIIWDMYALNSPFHGCKLNENTRKKNDHAERSWELLSVQIRISTWAKHIHKKNSKTKKSKQNKNLNRTISKSKCIFFFFIFFSSFSPIKLIELIDIVSVRMESLQYTTFIINEWFSFS